MTISMIYLSPKEHNSTPRLYSNVNHDPIIIDDNTDLLSQGWAGNGTTNDPFQITGLFINVSELSSGIIIRNTDLAILIENCIISGSMNEYGGIILQNTKNITIANCTIRENGQGVALTNCEDITITNSSILYNSQYGIVLEACHNVSIIENILIANNHFGIDLGASYHCLIMNNIINEHANGINFSEAWENTVIKNRLFNNSFDACYLYSSSQRNQLKNNTIIGSGRYGIHIQSITAFSNIILYNQFIGNKKAHVLDNGDSNTWDDGISLGNYWDNYSTQMPLIIVGTSNSTDHYPQHIEYDPFFVQTPPEHIVIQPNAEQYITWIAVDAFPQRYIVYLNGIIILENEWDTWDRYYVSPIFYLTYPGQYNFTIQLSDATGHVQSHSILVTSESISPFFTQIVIAMVFVIVDIIATFGLLYWWKTRNTQKKQVTLKVESN